MAVNITVASTEMVGDERMEGTVATVAREQHSSGVMPSLVHVNRLAKYARTSINQRISFPMDR